MESFFSIAPLDYRCKLISLPRKGCAWPELKVLRTWKVYQQMFFKGMSPGVLILKFLLEAASYCIRGRCLISLFNLMLELEQNEVDLRASAYVFTTCLKGLYLFIYSFTFLSLLLKHLVSIPNDQTLEFVTI